MPTLADRLEATANRPSGFDYLRLALAINVVCWHSVVTTDGDAAQWAFWHTIWWAPFGLSLPMFFALSGFLVAGSLERSRTLFGFLGLRALRILPALAVEVCICALTIGPACTTLPLNEYFHSPEFKHYFLNMLGDIHYTLPGLFLRNPLHRVNGQLWTIPWELACYAALSVLSTLGLYQRKIWLAVLLGCLLALEIFRCCTQPALPPGLARGTALLINFLAGLGVYRFRHSIPHHAGLFWAALALGLILMDLPNGNRFAPIPVSYCVAYLGLLNPPRSRVLLGGDYSYGIFLYSMPLQQVIVQLGLSRHSCFYNLLFAIPASALIAYLSWWHVEKPALKLRASLRRLEEAVFFERRQDKASEERTSFCEQKEAKKLY